MNTAVKALGGLLALVLLAGCASVRSGSAAESVETVEAEGWAPVDPKDEAGTRRRALAEAQKKAVETVTGVFLAASTRVDAAVAVRQKIMADVRGYIRRYEIISEKAEAGFHKTMIRALVLRRRSGEEDRGPDADSTEPPPENTKVSVTILGSGPQAAAWGASAVSAVSGRLLSRGFNIAEAGSAAPAAKPDFIVRGEARAYGVRDPRLGAFLSYRGKVTLEVIEPGTGAVIWRRSQEASALGVDSQSASSQAIENAGALVGAAAAGNLTAYLWKQL